MQIFRVNAWTRDIFCDIDRTVQIVTINWRRDKSVCSLYISGGRNVAIKQKTSQSSNFETNYASHAVDGNESNAMELNSCTHTNSDYHPWWNVTLQFQKSVNRYVIINRDNNADRIKGFTLASYHTINTYQQPSFVFTDHNTQAQSVYTIISPAHIIQSVRISLTVEQFLTLCEVEIFGDSVCDLGTYGRECENTCNCENKTETCFVATGGCPSGCAAGFYGEHCRRACPRGRWGVDCLQSCNESCYNNVCDSINGECLEGCLGFSDPPKCRNVCEKHSYGRNCLFRCPVNCPNECNPFTGVCHNCIPGYEGPTCERTCQRGWFGSNCRYKCHCTDNNCMADGECGFGSTCQQGWFGPGCQYQDLSLVANISTTPAHHGSSVLTDAMDDTCFLIIESINLVWKSPYPLSWIRIIGTQEPFTLYLKENTTALPKLCQRSKTVPTGDVIQDVYCTTDILVTDLIIAWTKNVEVCSLYISGGRNIALKQDVNQSSTHLNQSSYGAGVAVDGLTTTYTQTDPSAKSPFWTLSLSKNSFIYRFVIFNIASFATNLRGFSLDVFDKNSTQIFRFTDKEPNAELVYYVSFTKPLLPVSQVKITVPTNYLSLAEVEIFGDSSCPAGWYGPECNKRCRCSDTSEACLVMTGGCSSGCSSGYYGESCDQECLPGYWGENCLERCPSMCYGLSCDRITGHCLRGCLQDNGSAECNVACEKGWFGANCKYKCHCINNNCDGNGLCVNESYCEFGWFGPACQYQDLIPKGNLTTPRHNIFLVSDGDDESCVLNLASIVIEWRTPIPFTWLRLIVLEPDYHERVMLQFKDSSTEGKIWNCTNPRKDLIDKRTIDFYCDIPVLISQLVIFLNDKRSVCSVYVSGGRNVALRQYAYQSSTYTKMGYNMSQALNAVDGSTLSSLGSGSCSRTNVEDPDPFWTLTFQIPQIVNRFVIYNNYELNDTQCCPEGLHEFKITSSNDTIIYEFNSSDIALKHQQRIYNILLPPLDQDPLTSVTIESVRTDALHTFERFIALCEVEIYGDSICPFGKYGRECRESCRCAVDSEACFVTTGGCPSGCAPGYYGEGCASVCLDGTWGIDCREKCGVLCTQFCNTTNGHCN